MTARVYSTSNDPRFREVEEAVTWQMRFPSGVQSSNVTSYGFHEDRRCRDRLVRHGPGLFVQRPPADGLSR